MARRPKAAPETESIAPSVIGDLAPAPDEPAEGAAPAAPDLERRIAAMEAQLAASEARYQALQQQHMSLLASRVAEPPPADEGFKVDLAGLPDPTVDLPGYLAGYHERAVRAQAAALQAAQAKATSAAQAAQQRQEQIDYLWDLMLAKYPHLADASEVIADQAAKIVSGYRAQGLDPEAAMLANPAGFVDQVATATESRLRTLGLDPATLGDAEPDPVPTGGHPRPRGAPDAAAAPSSMVDEIKARQRQLKLF